MKNKMLKCYMNDSNELVCETIVCKNHIIEYEELRKEINGWIEFCFNINFGERNITLVVDEEGNLKELKPTFYLHDIVNNKLYGYPLVGNILFIGYENTSDGIESVGLDDDDIQYILKDRIKVSAIENVVSDFKRTRTTVYTLPLSNKYIYDNEDFKDMIKQAFPDLQDD